MKILAIVAARGGSKGLENKNIRNLLGKPLIAYTVEQTVRWGKYDKFIVSTDSKEIADIAMKYGAEVPFLRPAELAGDRAAKLDALRHGLIESERHYNMRFDILLDLDATAPLRRIEDIDNIVKLFKEKRPDCAFSAVKARRNPYFNMVEKQPDGTAVVCKSLPSEIITRQGAPEVFSMNASIYVYDRDFILDTKNKTPYSKKAVIYEMEEITGFDIDTEIDFKIVEFFIKKGIFKNGI